MEITDMEETQSGIIKQLSTAIFKVNHHQEINEKDNSIKTVNEAIQCRICMQNSLESDEDFIQPCLCTGSLMYVHESCFSEWMKRLLIKKNNGELEKIVSSGIQCELCKMDFTIKVNFEKVCTTGRKLQEKIRRNKFQFAILLIFILLSIILLSITTAMMPSDIFNFSNKSNNSKDGNPLEQGWQKVVLITSGCVLILVCLFSSYLLIKGFGFSYAIQLAYKGKQIKTLKMILNS